MNSFLRRHTRGFALLEAIISVVVAALGLVAVIKFQGELFQSGAVAKQRTVAVALAQERIEELRGFVNSAGYVALESAGTLGNETIARDGASFTRATTIAAVTQPYRYLDVLVQMSWTTAKGVTETSALRSSIAWADPANAGTLLSNTVVSATGNCSTQTVTDNQCTGSASAATNGATVTVSYSAGGSGSGTFLCTNGAFTKQSGTCSADCFAQTVTDSTCSAAVPATANGSSVSVTYAAGGTGSAVWACGNGSWSKSSGSCTPLNCTAPWGAAVAHGSSVTAYSSNAPASACSAAAETRTCNNGTLSGSHTNQSCNEPCNGGAAFGLVPFGASVTAYQAATASTCVTEQRTCAAAGGSLTGSYAFSTCEATASVGKCTVATSPPTDFVQGASRDFFLAANAASCAKKTYFCNATTGLFTTTGTSSGSTNTSEGYSAISCNDSPCTYSYQFNFVNSNDKFCVGTGNTPYATVPSGSTAPTCLPSNSDKAITCTGTVNVGSSVTVTPTLKKRTSCSAISCAARTITCGTAAVATNLTCTTP